MLHNEHIIPVILIALLTTTSLATLPIPSVHAQQEMNPIQTFTTPEQYNKIVISSDGKYTAAMSNTADTLAVFNQTHRLWNTHITDINSVAMSKNANMIATATTTDIQIFNTNNPTPQQHYDLNHENPMITLSGDGSILACAATTTHQNNTTSTTLYMFQTETLTPTWHTTLNGTLENISTSHNGSHTTITTNQPAALHLFTRQQQTPLWTYNFEEHSGAAKISSNGNYIIATGGNQTSEYGLRVYRFNLQSSKPSYRKIISELPSTPQIAVSSQGSIFALGFSEGNRLVFFNLDLPPYRYGPGSVLNITLPGRPIAVEMSSEGKYIAVGTDTGIYIYEYVNNELSLAKQYTNNNPNITDVAITPEGWRLAATATSTIYLFDLQQTQNRNTDFWIHMTILTTIILAALITSICILRRKRKPQKPANTN